MTVEAMEELQLLLTTISDMEDTLKLYNVRKEELCAELYDEGVRALDNGLRIIRSSRQDVNVRIAKDLVPQIWEDLTEKMARAYVPEPTLTQLKEAIAHLPDDQQKEILSRISKGEPKVSYTIRKGRDTA